jgi:hypothetical protein
MTTRSLAAQASLLLGALLTMAASPPRYTPVAFAAPLAPPTAPAPAPAPSPAAGPVFAPAPVPNIDLKFGGGQPDDPTAVTVAPKIYSQQPSSAGDGYTPHSTLLNEQTKRILPSAGLNLLVPLQ